MNVILSVSDGLVALVAIVSISISLVSIVAIVFRAQFGARIEKNAVEVRVNKKGRT